MNKYLKCAIVFLVAMIMVAGLVTCVAPTPVEEVETLGIGRRPLAPCLSHCDLEDLTADKYVILVDLSDNVNYPHYKTNMIVLKSLRAVGNLSGAVDWRYEVGVITAVTTATTSVEWIHGAPVFRSMYFRELWWPPEHGLSLEVRNATLENVATNAVSAIGTITTSVYVSTCRVISGVLPGVGDLILFVDEISDTAALDFYIDVGYDAE